MSPQESLTTVVVPTVGRDSLRVLLEALDRGTATCGPVVVVNDRETDGPLPLGATSLDVRVVRSPGRGPAAARNVGWRIARTPWVSFLDDDVVPSATWSADLRQDLATVAAGVVGVQGVVHVPMPAGRRQTDWERGTAGLEDARWITADLTYRRTALAAVGGFDERFPRAYREDADLGLRVTRRVGDIVRGRRTVDHPVRPSDRWASLRQQRGNQDDFLMRAVHGPRWRQEAGAPAGRRVRHVLTTGAAGLALLSLARRRRFATWVGALGWLAGTAELTWSRVRPGPRDRREVTTMVLTSVAIPFAASWHSAVGAVRHRGARAWRGAPDLVLFDRDGTLVHDVPYNGEPALVRAVPGARRSLDRLRARGLRTGVVTNQSAVGTGRITAEQLGAVQARVVELLGPFDSVEVCPHAAEAGCACRKPEPSLVERACAGTGVRAAHCVVVGDTASDLEAASRAGARGILIPTPATRAAEVTAAERVDRSLTRAVDRILAGQW